MAGGVGALCLELGAFCLEYLVKITNLSQDTAAPRA